MVGRVIRKEGTIVEKKKIFILAVVMIMVLSMFAACGNSGSGSKDDSEEVVDDSLTKIQEKGKLVLGCDDQFPPMGFDDNGTLVGFDIDLAKAVASKMGVELEAKAIDWSAKEMELESGNIDVIWNGYTITAERIEKVQFTRPYLNNAQMLVVKADSDVNSIADLAGKTIGFQIDSAASDIYDENTDINSIAAGTQEYDTFQQALLDLKAADRIQAVIVDKVLIEYAMQQEPGTFRIIESLGTEFFGIGCPKGAVALADAIDDALDELYDEGTVDEISGRWFESNIVIRDVARLTAEDFASAK